MTTSYTNAQFRSILFGLGYLEADPSNIRQGFPVTADNSPLTGAKIMQGIRNFQNDYGLATDGSAGPNTMAKAAEVMKNLQFELNAVVDAGLPSNQPFYGPQTEAGVNKFLDQLKIEPVGVISRDIRQELDELTKQRA
ncbi:MAG: peptidoglycan-binding protein [Nostocaceae cyanobacterium]|nr:peptidoglycan-binding protein [Nostocaceae cyanobacterium]